MIDVLATIKIGDVPLTLFGKIDESKHRIELNYQIISEASMKLSEIIYNPKLDLAVVDTRANQYSVYGCKFTNATTSFSNAGITLLQGVFDRLVKEETLGKQYIAVQFRFKGIEKIFPLERFSTTFETPEDQLSFIKESQQIYQYSMCNGMECLIKSKFTGVTQSDNLFELEVKQYKAVSLTFKEKKCIEELIEIVKVVKKYFEFILKQEISLTSVEFTNEGTGDFRKGQLLFDPLLQPHTFIKELPNNPYRGSAGDLLNGLNGWLDKFNQYSSVIDIWQKTVYNTNVSADDLFIWRCQAFELLCTLNEEIFNKANSLKGKKQQNPNLRNFLNAVNTLYGISKTIDQQFFGDVKEVRDKLTHNNPTKQVTERQRKNSYIIIEYFLIKTISKIMGITGIPVTLFLWPEVKENK